MFFKYGKKPSIEIAGIGHRTISSDKEILKKEIKKILKEYDRDYRAIVRTAFATGADQLIAECAVELGVTIKAVLPYSLEEYIEKIKEDAIKNKYSFTETEEIKMRHLLSHAVACKKIKSKDNPYLAASQYLIHQCDKMIALWDGIETPLEDQNHNPINQGGTYHCIQLARAKGLTEEDIHIIHCER